MSLIDIVMPCYNAAPFLPEAVRSVLAQTFQDWILTIVDDGSTDDSLAIAHRLAEMDQRIRVIHKKNGGCVSARIEGYRQTDCSRYLLFFDADDQLHPEMLHRMVQIMITDEQIGAAYCNHQIMDAKGHVAPHGIDMPRYIPTRFWLRSLPETEPLTPFISIFSWTKMIEPMTLLRREAYEEAGGWDLDFGRVKGNLGDGVYLFSDIALRWKVYYERMPLYYYRRHPDQITAIPDANMKAAREKVIGKWIRRIATDPALYRVIHPSILFLRHRLSARHCLGSFPHELTNNPFRAASLVILFFYHYLRALPLVFSFRRTGKMSLTHASYSC